MKNYSLNQNLESGNSLAWIDIFQIHMEFLALLIHMDVKF